MGGHRNRGEHANDWRLSWTGDTSGSAVQAGLAHTLIIHGLEYNTRFPLFFNCSASRHSHVAIDVDPRPCVGCSEFKLSSLVSEKRNIKVVSLEQGSYMTAVGEGKRPTLKLYSTIHAGGGGHYTHCPSMFKLESHPGSIIIAAVKSVIGGIPPTASDPYVCPTCGTGPCTSDGWPGP